MVVMAGAVWVEKEVRVLEKDGAGLVAGEMELVGMEEVVVVQRVQAKVGMTERARWAKVACMGSEEVPETSMGAIAVTVKVVEGAALTEAATAASMGAVAVTVKVVEGVTSTGAAAVTVVREAVAVTVTEVEEVTSMGVVLETVRGAAAVAEAMVTGVASATVREVSMEVEGRTAMAMAVAVAMLEVESQARGMEVEARDWAVAAVAVMPAEAQTAPGRHPVSSAVVIEPGTGPSVGMARAEETARSAAAEGGVAGPEATRCREDRRPRCCTQYRPSAT